MMVTMSGQTAHLFGMSFLMSVLQVLVFLQDSLELRFSRTWGQVDVLDPAQGGHCGCCRLFCSVSDPRQTVQRAKLGALSFRYKPTQRFMWVEDNLNVVQNEDRLLDHFDWPRP